ncbi:MAG: flagellar hook-length control protein FliK [Thiobacillaceae bacterium]|nr:flagellar hook-length control protein FliK [Thiobacillaceae bacterium]
MSTPLILTPPAAVSCQSTCPAATTEPVAEEGFSEQYARLLANGTDSTAQAEAGAEEAGLPPTEAIQGGHPSATAVGFDPLLWLMVSATDATAPAPTALPTLWPEQAGLPAATGLVTAGPDAFPASMRLASRGGVDTGVIGDAANPAAGRQKLPAYTAGLPVDHAHDLPVPVRTAVDQILLAAEGDGATPALHGPATTPSALRSSGEPPSLVAHPPLDLVSGASVRDIPATPLPLRAQGWESELAQRVLWMAGRQQQWAEIVVNPPELGLIEIHLRLSGKEASAYFYSPHASVRELLDGSLPRLRELLAGAGIQLGQAQIGQESLQQGRQDAMSLPQPRHSVWRAFAVEAEGHVRQGLVDLYV